MNKIWIAVSLLSIIFTGCSDEADNFIEIDFDDRIQLFIPDAEEIQVYSTATESENLIEDCFVVTFSDGGAFKNAEKIDVSKIVKNHAVALLPQLSFKIEMGDKVYVICNTGMATLPGGINQESDLDDKFKPAKDYYFGGEALPMSGSITWATSSTVVTLIRTVAKVQIQLGESFNIGGSAFEPDKYWDVRQFNPSLCGFVVGNYAAKSNILQNASALSQNKSGRSAFYGTTGEAKFIRFIQYAGSADSMTIYVSEYPNATRDCEGNPIADNEFNEKRQFLLMLDKVSQGSAVLGDGTATGAWRLDFYDAVNRKYLDIKRNRHYIFTVERIRSAPYHYPLSGGGAVGTAFQGDQEVWHNPGSNIEYTIYVKDSWVGAIYTNGQYAISASVDTIRDEAVPFRLKVEIPAGVDISRTTTHILHLYDSQDRPIGNTGDNLEVNGYPTAATDGIPVPISGSTLTLNFTVNDFEYLDDAYMIVRVGNIFQRIPIRLSPWVYMPDPGFRAYSLANGYIADINPVDNNYVKISSAGKAATVLNMNREGYYGWVTDYQNLVIGGIVVSGGFGRIPDIIYEGNPSDVDISLWAAVKDLTGIEAFTNLEELYLNGNQLTTLDLSQNKKLKRLDAETNQISSVTFDNPELFYVDLLNSQLSSIDTTRCSTDLLVLMVTGYTTLNGSDNTSVVSGQGRGVKLINQNSWVQGSLHNKGGYSFSLSKEMTPPVYIEIREPTDYKVIQKLLREQGVDI
jgi:hypothetical protein